jgi:hypothetical protein
MTIDCPFCGEPTDIDTEVDLESADPGEHVFVQDCDVCCHPITVRLRVSADGEVEQDYDRA